MKWERRPPFADARHRAATCGHRASHPTATAHPRHPAQQPPSPLANWCQATNLNSPWMALWFCRSTLGSPSWLVFRTYFEALLTYAGEPGMVENTVSLRTVEFPVAPLYGAI